MTSLSALLLCIDKYRCSIKHLPLGDVVGPGFTQPYLDAETLINKPFGSAEQNMFNFATNLYNLKYLKITNQLSQDVLQKALNGMNLGKSGGHSVALTLVSYKAIQWHEPWEVQYAFSGKVELGKSSRPLVA